jgi:hypothetical protein
MKPPVHPAILKYTSGELSAGQAADLLGPTATVADVIVMAKNAGLGPPRQSARDEATELAHARAILGIRQP